MSSEIDWKKMMADVEQKNRNTANETFKEIIPEHIIKEQCACLEVVNDFGIVDKLSSIKDQLWGMGDVQITNGSGYIFNEYIQNWQNHDFWTRQNSKLS